MIKCVHQYIIIFDTQTLQLCVLNEVHNTRAHGTHTTTQWVMHVVYHCVEVVAQLQEQNADQRNVMKFTDQKCMVK